MKGGGGPTAKRPKNEGQLDSFVAIVLSGEDEAKDGRLTDISSKRREVDADMKEEAIRVAEAALEGIRKKKEKDKRKTTKKDHKDRPKNRIGAQSAAAATRLDSLTVVNHDKLMKEYLMSATHA